MTWLWCWCHFRKSLSARIFLSKSSVGLTEKALKGAKKWSEQQFVLGGKKTPCWSEEQGQAWIQAKPLNLALFLTHRGFSRDRTACSALKLAVRRAAGDRPGWTRAPVHTGLTGKKKHSRKSLIQEVNDGYFCPARFLGFFFQFPLLPHDCVPSQGPRLEMYDKQLNFKARLINALRVSEEGNTLSLCAIAALTVAGTSCTGGSIMCKMRWNTGLDGNLKISGGINEPACPASVQQVFRSMDVRSSAVFFFSLQ